MKPLILLGTARPAGNTDKVVRTIAASEFDIVLLGDSNAAPYRYATSDPSDGFISLAENLVTRNLIVLAAPVYWYAMSGVMKDFFDRLTESPFEKILIAAFRADRLLCSRPAQIQSSQRVLKCLFAELANT